jgi:hypothetical protein
MKDQLLQNKADMTACALKVFLQNIPFASPALPPENMKVSSIQASWGGQGSHLGLVDTGRVGRQRMAWAAGDGDGGGRVSARDNDSRGGILARDEDSRGGVSARDEDSRRSRWLNLQAGRESWCALMGLSCQQVERIGRGRSVQQGGRTQVPARSWSLLRIGSSLKKCGDGRSGRGDGG